MIERCYLFYMSDKQVAVIAVAHPYYDNSHVWLIGIMRPIDATNLLTRLRVAISYSTNGFKHLGFDESTIIKLSDIHSRAIPCMKTCNCKQSIGGYCFTAWGKREHFERASYPYVIDYEIIS